MSFRDPEYKFVSTDVKQCLSGLIADFERITDETVKPASKDRLLIQWAANIAVHLCARINYAGNQNLASRADGENLDELGKVLYFVERPEEQPAACNQRFHISAAQGTAVLVPAGTGVTDSSNALVWATKADAYIPIGALHTDIAIECQTPGIVGNGYAPGQINKLIDINSIAHFLRTENITMSDGGARRASDGDYYDLMRESRGSSSTAGAGNAYVYHAKKASAEIGDVVPTVSSAGTVSMFVLMKDGSIAGEEIKKKVFDACSPDGVRPLTDYVVMDDPEVVKYNIDFTYYIPSMVRNKSVQIEIDVRDAVNDYMEWQRGKLGRDINPDELQWRVKAAGVKRIVLREPLFMELRDGKSEDPEIPKIPQVAAVGTKNVVNGGYEDE